ncbi:MAG: hypothetical protein HPY85_06905 [Anaerolineae bacterium]|nr:hypothetical protein [Anaerolineae bacterium]
MQEAKQEGPYLDIEYTGGKVHTEEDLVRAHRINMDEYVVVNRNDKAWEVTMKVKDSEGEEHPIISTNHYIALTLMPRVMQVPRYRISPVRVVLPDGQIATIKRRRKDLQRLFLWSDPHFGFAQKRDGALEAFHDEGVLAAWERLMAGEKIGQSVCLGDLLDNAEWTTKFLRSPEYFRTTQHALTAAATWLLRLKTSDVLEGIHDARIGRFLLENAVWAYELRREDDLRGYPLLSIPSLLLFQEKGMRYQEGYPSAKKEVGDFHLFHGDVARKNALDTARTYLKEYGYNCAFGHIHRHEVVSGTVNGQAVTAFGLGCSCRVDGVVPGHNPMKQHWDQVGAVLEITDEGRGMIEPVYYDPATLRQGSGNGGYAVYRGRRY